MVAIHGAGNGITGGWRWLLSHGCLPWMTDVKLLAPTSKNELYSASLKLYLGPTLMNLSHLYHSHKYIGTIKKSLQFEWISMFD